MFSIDEPLDQPEAPAIEAGAECRVRWGRGLAHPPQFSLELSIVSPEFPEFRLSLSLVSDKISGGRTNSNVAADHTIEIR